MDGDHGRIETSTRLVCTEVAGIQKPHQWPGLAEIGRVIRTRDTASSGDRERLLPAELGAALSPEHLRQVARSHWGVENRLHWVLNAVMHEDATRNRNDNSAYNLPILRHRALNLMQRDRWRVSLPASSTLPLGRTSPWPGCFANLKKSGIKTKCWLILIHFVTKQ